MARYILNPRYALRGWQGLPFALWDNAARRADFYPKEQFLLLARCDGMGDIDFNALPEGWGLDKLSLK